MKTDPPIEGEKISQPVVPTSVKEELKQKALVLGVPVDGLLEAERNEGSPTTLVDDRPFAAPGLIDDVDLFISKVDKLQDLEIDKVWNAIAPHVPAIDLLLQIDLQKLAVDDLKDLVCVAQEELKSREKVGR